MKLRHLTPLAVVLVVFGALLAMSAPAGGARSVHDRTPRGYRAAFAWLESRGETRTWNQPLSELADLPPGTTLLLVWPLASPLDDESDTASLLQWITAGNRVVFALDGASTNEPPIALVDQGLEATVTRETPTPPWDWTDWKAWEAARRRATGSFGTIEGVSPEWWITCPGTAIATDPEGRARVCRIPRGSGEAIVVMDATIWQNDHIARADNLDLLAEVFGAGPVAVDEWHHDTTLPTSTVPTWVPGLLVAHLVTAWLVAGLTLSRRFGDPLPTPAIARASMAQALRALAALHVGVGHAADAGRRMHALLTTRAHRKGVDPSVFGEPPTTTDRAFSTWAARAATLQRELRL